MNSDKVILITGASRGIGESIYGYLYWKNNYDKYILISRKIHDIVSNNIHTYKCDCTKYSQVKNVVKDIYNKYGRIDVLINCVGKLELNSLIDETEKNLDDMYKTNVKSYWYVIKEVLPIMKKQKSGYIINISSMQAKRSFKNKSSYAMSKSAINSLTESINREYNGFGIRSTAICPGYVNTSMVKNLNNSGVKLIPMRDVSKTVDYLLSLSKVPIVNEICLERKLW